MELNGLCNNSFDDYTSRVSTAVQYSSSHAALLNYFKDSKLF